MRQLKILITGSNSTLDNGEAALLETTIESLSEFIPNAHFVVGATDYELDSRRYRQMLPGKSIKVVAGVRAQTRFPVRAFFLLLRYVSEYLKADVGIDVSGDGFSDFGQHGVFSSISHAYQLLLGVVLKKPVVVYAQSIGPFRTKLTTYLAKFVLNKVDLITVREEISKRYLETIGVRTAPTYLTADSAFLLKPATSERVDMIFANESVECAHGPLIGISGSQVVHRWAFNCRGSSARRYMEYVKAMARAIDYVIENMDANVIIVSQTTGVQARHDDRMAATSIYENVKNKHNAKVLTSELTPAEYKGVIGRCHMFIGSKMHSAIASTSMMVPTISIAYSHKIDGIIGRMLKQEKAIVDIRTSNYDEFLCDLLSKIDYVWSNRNQIRDELRKQIRVIQKQAQLNAKLTAILIRSGRQGLCRFITSGE